MGKLVFVFLCLMAAIEPWEGMAVVGELSSFSRLLGFAAFGTAVLAAAGGARIRGWPVPWIFLVLFAFWNTASITWSVDPSSTIGRSITYAMLLTFAWMIWEFATSLGQLQILLLANWLGCLATLLAQLVGFHAGRTGAADDSGGRFIAEATDANWLAGHFALAIAVAFYFATNPRTRSPWLRLALWAFMVPAVAGVFLTGSRGGMLALLVVAATILVGLRRVKWTTVLMFLACAGAAWYIVPGLLSDYLRQRLTQGTEAHSYQIRLEAWRGGLEAWTECPLQGTGGGTYVNDMERVIGIHMVAHNTFMSLLVEDGLVGLGLFLLAWAMVAYRIRLLPARERLLCFSMLACQLPVYMSVSAEYTKSLWFLFAIVLSLEGAWRDRRTKARAVALRQPRLRTAQ